MIRSHQAMLLRSAVNKSFAVHEIYFKYLSKHLMSRHKILKWGLDCFSTCLYNLAFLHIFGNCCFFSHCFS